MKPFKTAEEQIQILESRGLTIDDHEYAAKFLIRRNYYSMINGYSKFFTTSDDQYVAGATLKEIESVYIFDKELKGILFTHLMEVEKYLKATLAYHFCEVHPGTHDYLNINSYICNSSMDRLNAINVISRIGKVISDYSQRKDGNAIDHYIHKHNGVPLWVVIQFMYFGDVIALYKCCETEIKEAVAKEFGEFLRTNTGDRKAYLNYKDLTTMLYQAKSIRNIVAHNNKLFDYVSSKRSNSIPFIPSIFSKYEKDPSLNRNTAFDTILMMQCLISPSEYAHLHNSVRKRLKDFKKHIHSIDYNIVTKAYGFPENWCDQEDAIVQESKEDSQ